MGRLFGTDGVRGIANEVMTVDLAMSVGRAVASVFMQGRRRRPLVVIGKDTRISCDMLEAALAAGLSSTGADIINLGVIPTPAVALLVQKYKADAGIMISASHNPSQYNGIKIFSGDGFKLPDDFEDRIESLVLDKHNEIKLVENENLGTLSYRSSAVDDYVNYLVSTIPTDLSGLRIAVDCANGASSVTAKRLFEELGAEATIMYDSPNGININEGCGSTHMENLQAFVKENNMDAGIAYDGDADRCLCVDENGEIIDGDFIIAICSLDMKNRGKLRKNTVVGTIMANMGFQKFCEQNGMHFEATKVGDRYVLEQMELEGFRIGGEQSGHVIFRDYSTTGDGQLTSLQLLCHLKASGKKLSELASVMTRFPQVMENVTVSKEGKLSFYNNDAIHDIIQKYKEELGEDGRVVVRVSGTEPLIRVMVEGLDMDNINKVAKDIAAVVKSELT